MSFKKINTKSFLIKLIFNSSLPQMSVISSILSLFEGLKYKNYNSSLRMFTNVL